MSENLDSQLEIDRQKIRNSIRLQAPVEITSYTLPRNMEVYCRKVLGVFLEECHQEHMKEYLEFCLGELLTNAKKANTKRIYFKEKNLDIYNPDDYQIGMKSFKDDTLSNINHYLDLQKKEGLYIKLLFQLTNENIKIEIRNNARITEFEKARIDARIENALKYRSPEEIIANVLDQSEGAGLGIMIIILMLQKVGLAKDCYQVQATDTETITRIVLPCNKTIYAGIEAMSYEFVFLQDNVPVNRETYNILREEFAKPEELNREKVFKIISEDVTLSVLLLNESMKKDKECINLQKIMGKFTDDELKNIYSDANPDIIFLDQMKNNVASETNVELWSHARKVAAYAFNMWKNFKKADDNSAREIYTIGLLNSLGRILLDNQTEEQKNCMMELSEQYEEPQKLRDLFQSGSSSPYLSYIYSKIHGYPEKIYYPLGKWIHVAELLKGHEDMIYILYLAEVIAYYNEGVIDYYQIKTSVLEEYGIFSWEQFEYIAGQLNQL